MFQCRHCYDTRLNDISECELKQFEVCPILSVKYLCLYLQQLAVHDGDFSPSENWSGPRPDSHSHPNKHTPHKKHSRFLGEEDKVKGSVNLFLFFFLMLQK